MTQTFIPPSIQVTDNAVRKVQSLVAEEENPELKLRVFVTGGGCSGFQYGFTFDEAVNEDDTQITAQDVTVLVDPLSYQYLVGAEVDYQGLEGSQFVVNNPNATSTCGCGLALLFSLAATQNRALAEQATLVPLSVPSYTSVFQHSSSQLKAIRIGPIP